MQSPGPDQRRPLDAAEVHRLSNSVEVLTNIFYLVEMHLDQPEQISHFLAIGQPALAVLEDFIRSEFAEIRSK
jgi:hypothetical protein